MLFNAVVMNFPNFFQNSVHNAIGPFDDPLAVQNWRLQVGLQRTSEQTTSLRGNYNLGAQDCFVHRFYKKLIKV